MDGRTQLIIDGVEVVLPQGFATTVKRENSFFTKNGEYTYDCQLSLDNDTNRRLYGFLQRLNKTEAVRTKRPATLMADGKVYCRGTEVITGWTDEQGWVYVIFPEEDLGKTLGRGRTAVSRALGDLEAAGLLERRPQPDHPTNRIYVKLSKKQPEACSEIGTRYAPKTEHAMSRKRNIPCSEKGTQVNIYNKYNNNKIKRDYSYQEEESL